MSSLVGQRDAGLEDTELDDGAEWHARFVAFRLGRLKRGWRVRPYSVDASLGGRGIGGIALDAKPAPAEALGNRAGGARTEKRVDHQITGIGGGQQQPMQQRLRLLRWMRLATLPIPETLGARADWKQPVGAHLDVIVQRLHRLIVEGDA